MSQVEEGHNRLAAPARTVTVSPLAVVMALLAVYAAYEFYQSNAVIFAGVGWGIVLGSAAVWAAYGAIAIAAIVLLQRYARRPGWTIALALSWGGLVTLYFSADANTALDTLVRNSTGSDAGVWATGPFDEELLKAVGVVALALVPVLRRLGPVDGLFYGVVVGAGFQVMENFTYALNVAFSAQPADRWSSIGINVLLRGLFGLFSHAVWTGIVGAAIGWAASGESGRRGGRALAAVAAFLLAFALHGTSNYLALQHLYLPNVACDVTAFLILVVILLAAQRHEKRRLTDLAIEHGGWGVFDAAELSSAESDRPSRRRHRLQLRYAYSAEQFGPHAPATHRAEALLR